MMSLCCFLFKCYAFALGYSKVSTIYIYSVIAYVNLTTAMATYIYIPRVFSPLHTTGLYSSPTVQLAFAAHRMILGIYQL